MRKRITWTSAVVLGLLLTGVGGTEPAQSIRAQESAGANTQASGDPSLAFQIRAIPMLEDFFADHRYSALIPAKTDYYFDNDHPDGPKIAFVTKKGNEPDIRELRQALEQRFGRDVVFQTSAYSEPELAAFCKEVADYVDEIHDGPYSAGYSIDNPRIEIDGPFTDEQARMLIDKFGEDRLEIEIGSGPVKTF
ncbi:hypothetical protein QWJ34_21795 [Saccharibacillus sp. CPCC 101409]|uniref:hypothetical protein n=1 Tax=Saccharibacillus sp. CPCC 101409 TaxID=3058041 RepID=UPI00267153DA|nr:hypothetical protein [Saccharibacillus sp. CPCC 101409]MDO3412413.1 hypothetical protein [Saccharibacillus sp. CPCC 101409]